MKWLCILILLVATVAQAELIQPGLYTNFVHDTLFGAADTIIIQVPPRVDPPGWTVLPWSYVVSGSESDCLMVSCRPLNVATDYALTAGSPFLAIPWLLTAGTGVDSTSGKVLDFADSSLYYSYDPDALVGTGLNGMNPIGCEAFEVILTTGVTDTTAYVLRWHWIGR